MSVNFPTSLDTLTNPQTSDPQNNPSHAGQHSDANDAIEALEAKVGANTSAVTSSHDYKISQLETNSLTAASSATLTNKTIDANGTGNSISNLETADLASGVLDTDLSSVSATDNTIPSAKATKSALDAKAPSANPTFTGTVVLPKTIEIQDTSADHQYVLAVNELTADRTVTLPLLAGNDEFTFNAHTQTLTNKRITKRVATTADDATAEINVDTTDVYELSAVANATEFSTTGTPTDGQTLMIRFKDAGAAKAITWNAIFVAIGVTAPATTVAGKWHYVGCQYNTAATKWHIIATGVQA